MNFVILGNLSLIFICTIRIPTGWADRVMQNLKVLKSLREFLRDFRPQYPMIVPRAHMQLVSRPYKWNYPSLLETSRSSTLPPKWLLGRKVYLERGGTGRDARLVGELWMRRRSQVPVSSGRRKGRVCFCRIVPCPDWVWRYKVRGGELQEP